MLQSVIHVRSSAALQAPGHSIWACVIGLLPPDAYCQVLQAHTQTPAGYGSVMGDQKSHLSLWSEREGGQTGQDERNSQGDSSSEFNCFCSFSLTLCTELEVWHFKVSFYRNKCQERWVILISLKIEPGCQGNQNFALQPSQRESKSLPNQGCAAVWGDPGCEGSVGLERLKMWRK